MFSLKISVGSVAQLCCSNIPPAAFSAKEEGAFSFNLLVKVKGTNRDGLPSGSDSDGLSGSVVPSRDNTQGDDAGSHSSGQKWRISCQGPGQGALLEGTAWQAVVALPLGIPKEVRIWSVMFLWGSTYDIHFLGLPWLGALAHQVRVENNG